MPPILKSSIQQPLASSAKPLAQPFDRAKAMKIKETTRGGKPLFEIYSVSGRLLGAATTAEKAKGLRDGYPLTTCLS